jgi:cap1 methyltransferase
MNFNLEIEKPTYKNNYEKLDFNIINTNNNLLFKKFYDTIKVEKEKIDKLENNENWDKMKKIGNPYELIYTTYNKKRKNDSISSHIPISRSYFKMWEIFHNYDFFKYFSNKNNIVFAHLAEGPGGFMEATYNYRKNIMNNCNSDLYYCITLKPTNEYIPDFNKLKKIFGENNNIKINYGNLYLINDVRNYITNFDKHKANIVTADGGFDYSNDFNGQEINSCQIIYSECIIALNILSKNGSFICKVFDLFSITMVQLMYIMYESFEQIFIYKPDTSRPANSEKYIVCLGYKDNLTKLEKENLLKLIEKWNNFSNNEIDKTNNSSLIFKNIKIDNKFINKLEEYNLLYMNNQMIYLNKTIELTQSKFDKDKYYNIIQNQVINALNWCKKYKVEINKNSIYYKKNIS